MYVLIPVYFAFLCTEALVLKCFINKIVLCGCIEEHCLEIVQLFFYSLLQTGDALRVLTLGRFSLSKFMFLYPPPPLLTHPVSSKVLFQFVFLRYVSFCCPASLLMCCCQ